MAIDYPKALLYALAPTVGVAILLAASTSGTAFGLYNPAWDGASELREIATEEGASVVVARDVSAYDEGPANGTVAVVLAPERRYAPGDAARLRSFVRRGGTLVVADDFGTATDPLLSAVGATARLDGRLVRDEQHYDGGPSLPVAADVADGEYTAGVDALTLNHGTVIEAGGATAVVNTSSVAYLDSNRNDELDDDEPIGPFPVVTAEAVGGGRVVVVGDPSALVNVMIERPGNRAFVRNLVSTRGRVLLDASHSGSLPPAATALLLVRDSPPLQVLVGLGAVGAVALWAGWPAGRRRPGRSAWLDRVARRYPDWMPERGGPEAPGLEADTLAAYLHRRHPDWDAERVERLVDRAAHYRSVESNDRPDRPAEERRRRG